MTLVNPPNAQLPLVDIKTGNPALGSGGLAFLQKITDALNGASKSGIATIPLGIGTKISAGTGSPNGVVSGSPGDIYLNLSGGAGTTLYVKESGANTSSGWTGK